MIEPLRITIRDEKNNVMGTDIYGTENKTGKSYLELVEDKINEIIDFLDQYLEAKKIE